jgi:hypothetical protein
LITAEIVCMSSGWNVPITVKRTWLSEVALAKS